ncbi:MAG: ABC transporter substrate-binding protein [Armatimonadota bacterium]|nr:ABC transporter substrate-binding protein [Armatimonadota bacterium]MDR7402325.1 ABC transporter substrate-binding protein [Armatimonadota bacterium]MDR7404368.1 ABC transporter substrate-binding protein [Armatimonadota bacterium]MDR7437310.1 ABC transporter substrate-binding protein [Armatimonadota bacterium]MDR7472649.1 ABC transporter substrate-binding protein [Armatimonadota bacterium]
MRRGAALLAVILGVLTLAGTAATAPAPRLVVYSALPDLETSLIHREFTRRTGIQVDALVVPAAGTLQARIRTEKDRPRADVFVGGSRDFHIPLAREGLLLPYRSPVAAQAKINPAYLDPDGYWHGWYLGALAIIVNTERFERELAPRGVRKPATWDDLIRPEFRGHFVMPSPVTTGGGYIFVAAQIFRLGEERAWAYLRALNANASQYTPTAPGTITLLERGEAIVGMMWAHEAIGARVLRAAPLEVTVPPDTGYEVGAVSIVKGGPNPEGAKAYVDFLMTRVPQDINARYGFRYPVRADVPVPMGATPFEQLKFVAYDLDWAIQNQARVRERWTREIGR